MKGLLQITLVLLFLAASTYDAAAQTNLVVTEGTPVLDGVASPGEWTSTPLVTTRGVTLNAMVDGDFLYLSASWADDTENATGSRITYDGSSWDEDGNEDRLALLFDMGQTGADGVNCSSFCHFPKMATNGGIVDVWYWKAAQSNPMGYSEDTYWDASGQQVDAGVSTVLVNELDASDLPSFMASSDPSAIKEYLVENQAALDAFDPYGVISSTEVETAVTFNSGASFSADDYVAGNVHRVPSGDVADIQSAGKYDNGVWTVEFKRQYAGSDHDFTVVPGELVKFSHEVFDNQNNDHAIDTTPIDATTYTLDFTQVVGVSVEPIDDELPSAYLLKQNYPNPFNPSTAIEFHLPKAGQVSLTISNVIGQTIAVPVDEFLAAGQYQIDFNAANLPSGIYIYTLKTEQSTISRQMSLLK